MRTRWTLTSFPPGTLGLRGLSTSATCRTARPPGKGVSPLQSAGFTAETLARIEKSLQDDAKVPTGSIMPQPDGVSPTGGHPGQGCCDCGQGRADAGGNNGGRLRPGLQLCPPQRLGATAIRAEAPETSIQLWQAAMLAVMAALGVPPSLYTSQGAALRESYRHLFGSLLEPLGQLIAAELSEKLEEEITIKWPERLKSDISALSRGFSSLSKDGYPVKQLHDMLGFPGDAPEEPEPVPLPVPDPAAAPASSGQQQPGSTTPSTNGATGRASVVF